MIIDGHTLPCCFADGFCLVCLLQRNPLVCYKPPCLLQRKLLLPLFGLMMIIN